MTPTLAFLSGPLGRELVRLGDVVIGEIAPHPCRGAPRAAYMLRLPECRTAFRPAASIEAARRAIASEISEWLLRAGVFYPGQLIEYAVEETAARE